MNYVFKEATQNAIIFPLKYHPYSGADTDLSKAYL
jgi:hypothetical protein